MDHEHVLAMNNAAVPNVNALPRHEFDWIVERAGYFRLAEDTDGVAGFVICLPSGLDYWSENYTWFAARHADFLYLDRVVVAARVQGKGVGTALYEDLHTFCAGKWPRITLEVNLRPPNPGSRAFHQKMGYGRVGMREYEAGEKAVEMFERQI